MQSGKLRSIIELQKSTNNVWAKEKDIYAAADVSNGSDSLDDETGYASTNVTFTMRRDSDVTTKKRFSYEGVIYYIESIAPDRTDRRRQVVTCIERAY